MKIELNDKLRDFIRNKYDIIRAVEEAIFEVTGLTIEDLRGPKRNTNHVFARMIFANICIEKVRPSVLLASYINKDHSSLVYWQSKHGQYSKYDALYSFMLEEVQTVLKQKKEEYGII